jgi:hypothetical protein
MKITLDVKFEDCKVIGDLTGNISGEVCFDEFGVITASSILSSSLGTDEENKKKAKSLLKNTAERVRATLIRKLK